MAFLAFDDTDSRQGGCTTHVAWRLAQALEDVDLIGPPELVRLNPNVPFKTRGNGALCLRIGHGRGTPARIGEAADGDAMWAFSEGDEPGARTLRRAFATAGRVIDMEHARDPATRPGLVAGWDPPPEATYWRAVQTVVGREAARRAVVRHTAHWRAWNGGRGLLGATAAAAWRGAHDRTFEAIGYRTDDRIGSTRRIDPGTVESIDADAHGCFDSWDPVHRVPRAVPATPCPVLFGVRGERPDSVAEAAARLGPERPAGFLVFRSNQATDDHVCYDGWRPYQSTALEATVAGRPQSRRGGHVFVRMRSDEGRMFDAAAFEPTKGFRDPVRALRKGDTVVAVGSFHRSARTLALEKLWIRDALPRVKRSKPACPTCGKRMRSRGRDAGYRCRHRHARRPEAAASSIEVSRDEVVGAYEVPVLARRHLARPLARGGLEFLDRASAGVAGGLRVPRLDARFAAAPA